MKQFYFIVAFFLCLNGAFAQWTRVAAIPQSHIIALAVHNSKLYAASDSNIIYKSDDGVTWRATSVSNIPVHLTTMGFYNNEIYIGTNDVVVFNSDDDGVTWHSNALSAVNASRFAVHNGILFAATFGDGIYALNTNTNHWLAFTNGLPFYSYVVQNIISSPNFLIAGAGSNGTYYRFNFTTNQWEEEYYLDNRLHPGLQINRLINRADTLWAVNDNKIIRSDNAGLNWVEDKIGTHIGADRNIYAGSDNYYTLTNLFAGGTWIQQRNKNSAVNTTWATNEEFLPTGYAWDIIEFNNKLFLAKHDGLYVKTNIILPVRFISFNAKCEAGKVVLTWTTAQEQNSSHFDIEKSADGIHWMVIGHLPAAGSSSTEKSYSFNDNNPVQNNYYRIAEYDQDGKVQYTGVLRSSCSGADNFTVWPNPVHDNLYINIIAANKSGAEIKVFDSKGALVKVQRETVLQGSNQFRINTSSLPQGSYLLSAEWNNGQNKKAMQIIKQ
ncbi:MAG: T9SS type A sorting domain-containing protein [Ginsengibacter sp.]